MQPVWAIGLMTGTALDGFVDIAMIKTDGERVHAFGPWALVAYPTEIQRTLVKAVDAAHQWQFQGVEPEIFREAEALLTHAQSEMVKQFLVTYGFSATDIMVVGFHGQTILHHAPKNKQPGHTRQLGDGQKMAKLLDIDVVYDFRRADVEAGGQGAPLSAIYHKSLLEKIEADRETAILNLGGVANLTWCHDTEIIAFDTGPANAPLNDWVKQHNQGKMDVDGKLAATGSVDEVRLNQLLNHPFMIAKYPKSLDCHDFTATMAEGLSLEDGAATLTAFTAASVGRALELLPIRPKHLIVCGGGRKNPIMMRELSSRAVVIPLPAEDVNLRGDALEAECFAYLAVRSLRHLPISYPLTTGVTRPLKGGIFAAARPG